MGLQGDIIGKKAIIIGSGDEAMKLFVKMRDSGRWENISVVDPEIETLGQLAHNPSIDIIINASDDPEITEHLRKIDLPGTDILSSFSAQLLFCTGNELKTDGNESGYRHRILESLHEIRRSVYLTKNKEELLKVILSISLQTLSADTGSIMLMNPRKRCLSIEMAQGLAPKVMNSTQQKVGTGISGRVARTGRPILITGKVSKKDCGPAEERNDLHSAICCPMLIGSEVVGVINVNSKSPERIFTQVDLRYLQSLAAFTAEIIKTSREYERTINASFALSVLAGIRDILQLDLPMHERLNLSMMKIVNSLQGKLCNLYWFDNESQQFFVQASSAFDINLYQNDQVRLNDFFTGRALRAKDAFAFSIKMGTSNFKKWFLAHPIIFDGDIEGLLVLYIISDHENFDKERALLGKIANLFQESLTNTLKLETSRLQSIQYSALSEVTFDLAGIHNVRQLAKVIVVNACMILEAESCIINLYNDGMNSFELFESFSIKGGAHISLLHKLDNVIALKAKSERKALIIADLLSEGYISEEMPTRSVITMCLRQNNMVMGALSVYDKNAFGIYERTNFSERDREVFVKLCHQVAKALNRFIVMKPSSFEE
jgi:signal transduction protein with GAF and PtsI domain